ncbi:MAG TPA: LuxR C-terminal-related transcriptional regulator [Acidimicrobiia bacterium]
MPWGEATGERSHGWRRSQPRRLLGRRRQSSPLDTPTRRERDVLAAIAEGRTNQGIAEALFMRPKTVAGVGDPMRAPSTPLGRIRDGACRSIGLWTLPGRAHRP